MLRKERIEFLKEGVWYAHRKVGEKVVSLAIKENHYSDRAYDVHYGASICHPNDNFCRRDGRLRALKRLAMGLNVKYIPIATGGSIRIMTTGKPPPRKVCILECLNDLMRRERSLQGR